MDHHPLAGLVQLEFTQQPLLLLATVQQGPPLSQESLLVVVTHLRTIGEVGQHTNHLLLVHALPFRLGLGLGHSPFGGCLLLLWGWLCFGSFGSHD